MSPLSIRIDSLVVAFRPWALLVLRLAVGFVFLESGWGKIGASEQIGSYFADLGLPFPIATAVFVAWVEFLGGAALMLGLFARLASLPLIVVMLVALITAQKETLGDVSAMLGTIELLYAFLLGVVAFAGPGALAVGPWLSRQWEDRRRVREPASV